MKHEMNRALVHRGSQYNGFGELELNKKVEYITQECASGPSCSHDDFHRINHKLLDSLGGLHLFTF